MDLKIFQVRIWNSCFARKQHGAVMAWFCKMVFFFKIVIRVPLFLSVVDWNVLVALRHDSTVLKQKWYILLCVSPLYTHCFSQRVLCGLFVPLIAPVYVLINISLERSALYSCSSRAINVSITMENNKRIELRSRWNRNKVRNFVNFPGTFTSFPMSTATSLSSNYLYGL